MTWNMTMRSHERSSPANGSDPADPFTHEDIRDLMDSMVDEAKAYWEAQKDYHALVASERAAKLSAGLLSSVVLCVVLASVLAFASLAAAIWIGRWMGDMALGFLLMGGVYLLIGLIFLWLWRSGYRDRFILRTVNSLYHG
jgi:hypothetical protein